MALDMITVNSRKYDGTISRIWRANYVCRDGPLIELLGRFDRDVSHPHLGLIKKGTVSKEYFWLDRWFNVFCFFEPDTVFRNFYCNVSQPPKLSAGNLDYVDLDIDVIVWPDRRTEILDRNEFTANAIAFGYSASDMKLAERGLAEILELIEACGFPFSERL